MAKNITIDDLAVMVQKGFAETATKKEMAAGFKTVNERLDKIENVLIKQHSEAIENLSQRMRRLEDALAMK